MRYSPNHQTLWIVLLALVILTTAIPVAAQDDWRPGTRHRKGWLVGFNAGWGGSSLSYNVLGNSITEDSFVGPMGGLRAGYAVSNSIAFTLEAIGFGAESNAGNWGTGAGLIAVTWWPDASGFFLRLGFGGGGGDAYSRTLRKEIHFEDAGAAKFGLGYEWQLTRHFALGLAVEGFSLDLEDVIGLEEGELGTGGVTIQFNWYL